MSRFKAPFYSHKIPVIYYQFIFYFKCIFSANFYFDTRTSENDSDRISRSTSYNNLLQSLVTIKISSFSVLANKFSNEIRSFLANNSKINLAVQPNPNPLYTKRYLGNLKYNICYPLPLSPVQFQYNCYFNR